MMDRPNATKKENTIYPTTQQHKQADKKQQQPNKPSMDEEKRDKTSAAQQQPRLTDFVEGSTLHGLGHVCTQDTHLLRRTIWLLLMLAMFACYLLLATVSIVKYYKRETVTKIDINQVEALDFPAVSICDQNKIARAAYDDDSELEHWISVMEYYSTGPADAIDILSADDWDTARVILERRTMEDALQNRARSLIVGCTIDNDFQCGDMFVGQMSDSTLCMTFTPQGMTSVRPGASHGLRKLRY